MTEIAVYSDSFGWGHMTRDAALVRAWAQAHPKDRIHWRVGRGMEELGRRLARGHRKVRVEGIAPGIRFVPKGIGIDAVASRRAVREWWATVETTQRSEAAFLKKQDVGLVFSDIRPEALQAAQMADIPALAVSNFSWRLICRDNWPDEHGLEAYLTEAYGAAQASFVLPLDAPCPEMAHRIRTPFLVRTPTKRTGDPRWIARSRAGRGGAAGNTGPAQRGGEGGGPIRRALIGFGKSTQYVAPIRLPPGWAPVRLAARDGESQDYFSGVDAVLTKAGYGMCSEAIAAGTPCLVSPREGFAESRAIVRHMVSNGWGWEVEPSDMAGFLERWEERPGRRWVPADIGGAQFIIQHAAEYIQ